MKLLTSLFLTLITFSSVYAQLEVNSYNNVSIGSPSYTGSGYDLNVTGSTRMQSRVYMYGGASLYSTNYVYGRLSVYSSSRSNPYALKVSGETSGYLVDIQGTLRVNSSVYTSDERYKKNIKSYSGSTVLSKLKKLEAKEYEFKKSKELKEDYIRNVKAHRLINKDSITLSEISDSISADSIIVPHLPSGKRVGFIAQEVEKVFPDFVSVDKTTGYYSVNYIEFIPVLWEAVKEQEVIIEDLQAQVRTNEADIVALRQELEKLVKKFDKKNQ